MPKKLRVIKAINENVVIKKIEYVGCVGYFNDLCKIGHIEFFFQKFGIMILLKGCAPNMCDSP